MARYAIRWAFAFLAFALLPAAVGFGLTTFVGAMIGAGLGLAVFLAAWLRCEEKLAGMLSGRVMGSAALQRSFARAVFDLNGPFPEVWTYEDPAPNALVVRGWRGNGQVLVSHGLIALLGEEELRAVLRRCVRMTRMPGIRFRTFSAAIASILLGLAPRSWVRLMVSSESARRGRTLGPISAAGFLLAFPAAKLFVEASRPHEILELDDHEKVHLPDALRDLSRSRPSGQRLLPGAGFLYLVTPGPTDELIPFATGR